MYKFFFIIITLFISTPSLFSQRYSIERQKYMEREFHRYEDLIRKTENHAKLIMKNIYKPNVMEFFTNCSMDTTNFSGYLKSLNYTCNIEKGIGAYIGFYLEDNPHYQRKVLHCVFEYELECGQKYFQLSYFLDRYTNSFSLIHFYRKSPEKDDDIIFNVLNRF